MVDFLSKAAPPGVIQRCGSRTSRSAHWRCPSTLWGGSSARLKSGGVSTSVRGDFLGGPGARYHRSVKHKRWTSRSWHGGNGVSHRQHSTERPPNMKRATRLPTGLRASHGGRPCKPTKILPTIRRKDLPVVHLPRQTRSQGGKTKLTNHRAAIILHAIGCGCYRETAAELASIKAETLSHWMGWSGEPH